ncbi:MAG: hypothetical protein QG650_650 [Patescibacteria group bacterium]|nr:hypothetical protein [Patescibacteria group bacterium]
MVPSFSFSNHMNTNVSHDSKDRLPELANIDAKLLGILIGKGVVREYSASDVSAMKTEIETLKAKYASVDPSEIASLTEREAQLRKKITIRLSGHFEGF